MTAPAVRLTPTTFRRHLEETHRRALAAGALQPIGTEQTIIEDEGVAFLVRVIANLARKDAERGARPRGDPFAPPEPELLVGDLSDTHVCVLNKFNVIDHHALLVTRAFEHQETLLSAADFQALCRCMAGYPALAFHNGGSAAGASQTHKHLQLVPLPLGDGAGPAIPMEAKLRLVQTHDGLGTPAALPFPHAWARLDSALLGDPEQLAQQAFERYCTLLAQIGVGSRAQADGIFQSAPYNMLMTADWMLLVPRRCEHVEAISINALGFAGSLFVRDREALARLEAIGPMAALRAVTTAGRG